MVSLKEFELRKKKGNSLKIKILKAGFKNQKEFSIATGMSHDMIRCYTCGNRSISKETEELFKKALTNGPQS